MNNELEQLYARRRNLIIAGAIFLTAAILTEFLPSHRYYARLVMGVLAAISFALAVQTHADITTHRVFNGPAPRPQKAYQGDAGYDLKAQVDGVVPARSYAKIPLGQVLDLPSGTVGIINERSSMGVSGLFTIGNIIDEGYRGEINAIVANMTDKDVVYRKGDKVAQILILKRWVGSDEAGLPERGSNGFGSTGA